MKINFQVHSNYVLRKGVLFVFLFLLVFSGTALRAQTVLLSEDFDNTSLWSAPGTWTGLAPGWVDLISTGTHWWLQNLGKQRSGTQYMEAFQNSNQYLITPGVTLTANVPYTFSFWYRTWTSSGGAFTINTIVGTGQTIADMNAGTLIGTITSGIATYVQASYTYTPAVTGTYYFCLNAFGVTSAATYALVDDVLLTSPGCPAPCLGWLNQNCTTCPKGCYIDGGTVIPSRAVQTASTPTDTGNYGYVYWTFNGTADSTYYFDLCSSTGTAGASWLRLHDARNTSPGNNYCMNVSSTPTIITQNYPNGCAGTGTGLSKLIWTCPASGTYYLESALGATKGYWGATGNQTAVLTYKTLPSSAITCTDVFYDKGIDGTNGNSSGYNNNENWTFTYYPTDTLALAINVQFSNFSTSPGDILCVYNGNSINAPILGCYSGPSITGAFTSTASDGSLTFRFTSDDSLVSSGWQANVSCVPSLGISNPLSDNNISIYPNPVMESISVSGYAHAGKTTVEISDVLGKRILALTLKNGSNETIDVHHLTSGMYYIRIKDENGNRTRNGHFIKR